MNDIEKYWHPKFEIVANLIHLLYKLDGCICGGLCHIVVDENNIRDNDLKCVIDLCNKNKDKIDSELSKAICEIMLQFSMEQRIILFTCMEDDYFDDDCDYDKQDFEIYLQMHDPEIILKNTDFNINE